MSNQNPDPVPAVREEAALACPCEGCGAEAGQECMPLSLCGIE